MKIEDTLKTVKELGVSTVILIILLYQFFATQDKLVEVIVNNTIALQKVSAALR